MNVLPATGDAASTVNPMTDIFPFVYVTRFSSTAYGVAICEDMFFLAQGSALLVKKFEGVQCRSVSFVGNDGVPTLFHATGQHYLGVATNLGKLMVMKVTIRFNATRYEITTIKLLQKYTC